MLSRYEFLVGLHRISFICFSALIFSSCATDRPVYHLWGSLQSDSFHETQANTLARQVSTKLSKTVVSSGVDSSVVSKNGGGLQLGVTQQVDKLVSRLGLVYNRYDDKTEYFFDGATLVVGAGSTWGLGADGTIGYNIWYFRPSVAFKYEYRSYSLDLKGSSIPSTTFSRTTNAFLVGPGIAIEVPVSSFRVIFEYDYRFAILKPSDVSSLNNYTFTLGVRFFEFELGSYRSSIQ